MGEYCYTISSWSNKEYIIQFSEMADIGCLCTFPGNYDLGESGDAITTDTVRNLALFGALVRLAITDEIEDGYLMIPHSVPEWIIKGIDRVLKA